MQRRVQETLEQVHLAEKAEHYPHELSGGQKQRVALARGLVNRPRLLLLDEPLGALDAKLREEMQLELIELQREVGVTFVFVTHAQQEALALSHRIAVMNEGRIEQLDEPSRIYGFPAQPLRRRLHRQHQPAGGRGGRAPPRPAAPGRRRGWARSLAPAAARRAQAGDKGVLALRPEQVRISAAMPRTPELKNRFPGTVREFLYVGDVTTYQVELDNGCHWRRCCPTPRRAAPGSSRSATGSTVSWRQDAGHVCPRLANSRVDALGGQPRRRRCSCWPSSWRPA